MGLLFAPRGHVRGHQRDPQPACRQTPDTPDVRLMFGKKKSSIFLKNVVDNAPRGWYDSYSRLQPVEPRNEQGAGEARKPQRQVKAKAGRINKPLDSPTAWADGVRPRGKARIEKSGFPLTGANPEGENRKSKIETLCLRAGRRGALASTA